MRRYLFDNDIIRLHSEIWLRENLKNDERSHSNIPSYIYKTKKKKKENHHEHNSINYSSNATKISISRRINPPSTVVRNDNKESKNTYPNFIQFNNGGRSNKARSTIPFLSILPIRFNKLSREMNYKFRENECVRIAFVPLPLLLVAAGIAARVFGIGRNV